MGLILDSSIVIAAERRGRDRTTHPEHLEIKGDQVGLTELVHGIYRAQTLEIRQRRESFINELLADLAVYPYTKETALLAGKIDGEQQSQGVVIPFGDLLIGAPRSPGLSGNNFFCVLHGNLGLGWACLGVGI